MKKVIVLLLCMVGMTAIAQKGENRHRGEMKNLTPEQIATLQTKKMTLALDLSPDQQSKIQAINLEKAKAHKVKMESRKATKESGEAKKPTSEEHYAMQNARLDQMIAQKAQMKNILSADQYDKWQKMAHRKGKHGKQNKKDGKRKT